MVFGINENVLTAYGTIWDGDGRDFIYYFSKLEKEHSDITIRLHTYGGSVFDGNLMCNAVERSTSNVTIIIDGIAASMGAVFILSSKNVKIVDNGYLMIHAPSSGSYGNAKDHESSAQLLRFIEDNFTERLITRTGKSRAYVEKWLEADTWFDAKTALQEGLISEIIPATVETVYPAFEPDLVGELESYNMYACALLSTVTPPPASFHKSKPKSNFIDNNMKQQLITTLALSAVNAQSSDTAVLEAVQGKINDLQASFDKEKEARTKAENDLKAFKKEQIKAMIDAASASASKPFTDDERTVYDNIGENSGVEALAHVLKTTNKPGSPNISAHIQNGTQGSGPVGRENWDLDQWQKEDPKGLEALATSEPEKFNTLFNAKYKK
ncbi:Clp protease ClpP [Epilithonimonas mollis]|uniref:ATP-dependent protease ClpP, protease subunit n=1 Tax=Epilithonimonas mollis TaxID=216903 RepID=A0A1M6UKI1_9FLAO|nr:Clp protease ClpP [Epilithonimonas mollis]SHK69653.1 ATP-dependent protease ClpP, protease subunit [Epilithonimonas mollis]